MLEVWWEVCNVNGDSLNSKLEVWWDVCRAYDDSLNSMLEVWWEVCSVYGDSLNSICCSYSGKYAVYMVIVKLYAAVMLGSMQCIW